MDRSLFAAVRGAIRQRRHNDLVGQFRRVLPRKGRQHIPRSDLQQDAVLALAEFRNAARELHGFAEMLRPVFRAGRLLGRNPFACYAGNVLQLGCR